MAQSVINIGAAPNDGTGDALRVALDKANSNFAELYVSAAKAETAVQPARLVSTGTGLTGGGSLAADRTLSLSEAAIASLAKADTALQDAAVFATAAQGDKADTAVQPSTLNDTIAGFDGPDVIANRNASTGAFSSTFDAGGDIETTVETYANATITTTYGYTDGKLTTLTATDGTSTWVQTLTYDVDGNLETISEWVLQ